MAVKKAPKHNFDSTIHGVTLALSEYRLDSDSESDSNSTSTPTFTQHSYFSLFPTFDHNPSQPFDQEFLRLAGQQRWKTRSLKYKDEKAQCYGAEYQETLGHLGVSKRKEDWQELCVIVGLSKIPGSITKCKKALKNVNVNLVDLMNSMRFGTPLRKFPNHKMLVKYSQGAKIFPKTAAKEDGFIRVLLKRLVNHGAL